MKVFIVRHAESELNATNMGQYPHTPLSKNGLRQAAILAERFSGIRTDAIFSSRYKRAMQTAQVIGRRMNGRVTYTAMLNEWKTPTEMLGQNVEGRLSKKIRKEQEKHLEDHGWHYSDEENFFDLEKRTMRFIRYLFSRRMRTVVLVSHGYMIRMLIAVMLFGKGMDMKEFYRLADFIHTTNTGITECDFENGRWRLIRFNDHSHLGNNDMARQGLLLPSR